MTKKARVMKARVRQARAKKACNYVVGLRADKLADLIDDMVWAVEEHDGEDWDGHVMLVAWSEDLIAGLRKHSPEAAAAVAARRRLDPETRFGPPPLDGSFDVADLIDCCRLVE